MQVGKRRAQQPHLGGGVSKINIARAVGRVRACQHQLPRQFEGVLVRPFKHERSGIGEDGGVEAGRNLGSNLDAGFARQAINHFRRGHGLRIDPVHLGKGRPLR